MSIPANYEPTVPIDDLRESGRELVALDGVPIALFYHEDEVRAVNNRCPHMGFPLTEGTVDEGILTCEWHHARFELSCGDTFDPWADDVETYPVEIADGTVYVNPNPERDLPPEEHWMGRLEDGLERNLRLVIAKGAVGLADAGVPVDEQLRAGVEFGTRYRDGGWSSGLTILTALANVAPSLDPQDRQRAMYQGLTEVANDCANEPPKFDEDEFDTREVPYERLKSWFRDCVEVRDPDGAERCLRTAIACGYDDAELAEIVAAAATDHRYLSTGHVFDHFNKTTEALDRIGWEHADAALVSLVDGLTDAERSEELAEWRRPDDLAGMCEDTFEQLDDLVAEGEGKEWTQPNDFTETLHGDEPGPIFEALETAIREGATVEQLASAVSFAAAKRVAQFATSNEFVDWNTVHHTFTYANAVHRMAARTDATELYRGVFDGAVNVYLDRFLNMPPAPYPEPNPDVGSSPDKDSDPDTDSSPDKDSDRDTDSSRDEDSDTDADSGPDGDSDTDADSSRDEDSDAVMDLDADSSPDAVMNLDADPNPGSDTDADASPKAVMNLGADSKSEVDSSPNAYTNPDGNSDPDAESSPNAYTNPHADPEEVQEEALEGLRRCFETEGEIDRAGKQAAWFLDAGGDPDRLKAELGNALLIEDTGFHTFQALEAGFSQIDLREDTAEQRLLFVAVARYMAAHYPTRREREGTFSIATRLHRGEAVHE